mmetsp:Transcript_16886/g.48937  ORF Transcript_16886/g.48937 Transcript_16886/m.48937 type:complete len:83 (+) Transcript_16886:424-672(+)
MAAAMAAAAAVGRILRAVTAARPSRTARGQQEEAGLEVSVQGARAASRVWRCAAAVRHGVSPRGASPHAAAALRASVLPTTS